jgi:hypothetical protein
VPFGQTAGPPASARQMEELLALLRRAGHSDFRDARGPMRFTQRQAAGKFTHDEAAELIDRLQASEHEPDAPRPQPAPRLSADEQTATRLSSEVLAAELQRRGWVVMEP